MQSLKIGQISAKTCQTSAMIAVLCGLIVADCSGLLSAARAAQGKKSDSVVKATVTSSKPGADGKQLLTVTLNIEGKWHLYANPTPPCFPGIATEVTVEGKIKPDDVKVDYPVGKQITDTVVGKYNVYEGKAEIKVTVKREKGDTSPLEMSIKVQACDDKTCLLPAMIKLKAD